MSDQKKALLENLAEITKNMSEEELEKLQTFAAGVTAGAACRKSGLHTSDAHKSETKTDRKEETT